MSGSVEERLLARSVRDPESGCLRWQGAHTPAGYGQISTNGKKVSVHRAAHELWIGPIPDGYDVDHVAARGCRHRDCIEPTHLEAVTHRENLLRGNGPTGRINRRDTCKDGHELTLRPDGKRRCMTCRRARHRAYMAARRAAA